MSRMLSKSEYPSDVYDLGDRVSFLHEGERLVGTVVRVYSSRELYHVEVGGRRYEVDTSCDDMRLERLSLLRWDDAI